MRLRIGTRGSALALWQSRHVAARLSAAHRELEVELVEIISTGDRLTNLPLSHVEGTGFFTATLEQALVAGEIDVAVHSYKDLPVESTPTLVVAAVPARGPVEDVLCARDGLTLASLPAGARVGTCSTRRAAQVRLTRPDLELVALRGNVPTRVARVGRDLDAIVLARAGLVRLGLEHAITETFSTDRMLPAPAQGALAIQCRASDEAIGRQLFLLEDAETRRAVNAERTLLHALGGGCSVPVGAIAVISGRDIGLTAAVFDVNGTTAIRVSTTGADAATLGRMTAERLVARGAGAVLDAFAAELIGGQA